MIDYLLVVLLFAFIPILIILMFIGCFYCFLFIQHCATYTDEDNADEQRSNASRTPNRETGTPTPSSVAVTNTQPQSIWERREIPSAGHSGGKRLGVATLTHASSDIIYSSSSSEPPPPPYHSICFNKFDKNKDIV